MQPHHPLTRKEKITIIVLSVLGGSALLTAIALLVRHYRKPPQRIEHGARTYRPEAKIEPWEPWQGEMRGGYQVPRPSSESVALNDCAQNLKRRADELLSDGATPLEKVFGKILKHYAANPHGEIKALKPSSRWASHRINTVEYYVKEFVEKHQGEHLEEKDPPELFALFRSRKYAKQVEKAVARGQCYAYLSMLPPVGLPLMAAHAMKFRRV